jgi:hypothetical protein
MVMSKLSSLVCFALALTALTARATDFVVTNTNPSGAGSLNQAITDANALAGPDRILFNIPGPGVHKIAAGQTRLPTILESLIIDGYGQPGAKPNSLAAGNDAIILIQIDGQDATEPGPGLALNRGFSSDGRSRLPANYLVRGLSLTGFILRKNIDFPPQVIHSTALAISYEVDSAAITGNFIGLLPDGETPGPNDQGIAQGVPANATIGGTDPALRNVISGNTNFGVSCSGLVLGNYIGTNASGTKAVGNRVGVLVVGDHSNSLLGGTTTGAGNLISGNMYGIYFGEIHVDPNAPSLFIETDGSHLRIQGNFVGVQADRASPLPNRNAVQFLFGSNNIIGGIEAGAGNLIAFNESGINLAFRPVSHRGGGSDLPSEGNQILSNSIYANGGLPIDLASDGATPNDTGDPDTGPNSLQNAPVITSTQISNGSATINCTFNSTPNAQFAFQYFSESLDLARPVQIYLGSVGVSTDADGNAQVSAVFPVSDTNLSFNVTATSQAGNTSEFARNPGRMENISTRARVQQGDNATIAGFIVNGTNVNGTNATAFIFLRGLGPSLHANFGLTGVLPDPFLELYDATGNLIASNDNWRDDPSASTVESHGLAPQNDSESALARGLDTGNYTVLLRDAQGASGLGLVEVYNELSSPNSPPGGETVNLSTRGFVQSGNNVMIAGLILQPGTYLTRIVARALGPSLAASGIANPLPDPVLELRDEQGALIVANDDWQTGQLDDLRAVGLAPANDQEAAIFLRLPPGAYTAIVRGKAGAAGIGLVEWYNLH